MLEFDGLNYFVILVSWIINMVVGAFWYSPAGFSKQWHKYTGIDIMKMPQDVANKAIGFVSISALIQAVALAVILNTVGATTAGEGLATGLLLWFGLVSATTVGVTFYSQRGWKFLWLNSSYFLVVMAINSVILAVW